MTVPPKKYLQSFGRTKARRLRDSDQQLMLEVLPGLKIEDFPTYNFKPEQIWLEIGFGDGGHLLHQAKANPEIGFVGCEPFINGTAKLLRGVKEHNLQNVKLFSSDFRLIAEKFPPASIDRAFILFPDPWPKKRHNKRRLISPQSLDLLAVILKPGAQLRVVTDHVDYAKWIISTFLAHNSFVWNARQKQDWQVPSADHIETKYQKKSGIQGRKPIFFNFTKI